MNHSKTGKFILESRKKRGFTQEELATKLGITAKAVSKWETGKGFPDVSLILDLCDLLQININELLSGEKSNSKNHETQINELLLEMANKEEYQNKKLIMCDYVIGILSTINLLIMVSVAVYLIDNELYQNILIAVSFITFLVGIYFSLKIENEAGYYECKHCHYKHVPKYWKMVWAFHNGMTRYLTCPKCKKKSWQKKVLKKEKNND